MKLGRRTKGALAFSVVAVVATALVLTQVVFTGSAGTEVPKLAQTEPIDAPMVASPTIAPTVEDVSPPGGPHEGIQVHGHWTIEVRNSDGTLAEKREFENAYAGNTFLAGMLARKNSVGG